MPLPDDINEAKLAEVALAILWLSAHGEPDYLRAWKGMDWDLLDILHRRGWIHDPVGKQKSVVFSGDGAKLAEEYFGKHFGAAKE